MFERRETIIDVRPAILRPSLCENTKPGAPFCSRLDFREPLAVAAIEEEDSIPCPHPQDRQKVIRLSRREGKFALCGKCFVDKKSLRGKIVSRHKTPDPSTLVARSAPGSFIAR